jgi:nitrogen regulatory protein PII
MVLTKKQKKIEIIVDAPLFRRVRDLAADNGIKAYTFQPISGGDGKNGRWLDDQVTGGAGSKITFTVIVDTDDADRLLSSLEILVDELGLMVLISDVEVLQSQ